MLEHFRQTKGYKMQAMYMIAGISRQGHQQAIQRQLKAEQKVACYIGFIEEVRKKHPGMGLRKIYEQFQPEGIGRDSFIYLGLEQGYRLSYKPDKIRTTRSIKSNRFQNLLEGKRFTDVNQIWVSDITYYDFGGQYYYIVLILDVYSRRIVGYNMSDNMRAKSNIKALTKALTLRGQDDYHKQLIHHSDRGSQYVSDVYTELLSDYGIQISMCKSVYENTHCERVNGTIKNEYMRRWEAKTPRQLYYNLERAVNNYNLRKHNSIGKSPINFEADLPYLNESERQVLEIYTCVNDLNDPNQLSLDLDNN